MNATLHYNDIKDRIEYSTIQEHPGWDCYMLHSPFTTIPPYFGTMEECEIAKKHLDAKIISELHKISETERDEIVNALNSIGKLKFKEPKKEERLIWIP